MGGSIFISYRRGEDGGFAGRLYDRLERTFRRQRLFMDVDSIAPGEDFVAILEARVAECDVLLALIGRGWLTAVDAAGRRRLDNPDDFVRIEVASGLAQGKRVIPVLIDDAPMPGADELPDDLKPLTCRQAVPLSHTRFKTDADRIVRALKQAHADAEKVRQLEEAPRAEAEAPHEAATAAAPSPSRFAGPSLSPEAPGERGLSPAAADALSLGERGGVRGPADLPDLTVFRDVDAAWCPEMVVLPTGEFLMGSPDDDEDGDDTERPQHRVIIGRRFAIGRYPITFGEYDHFCAAMRRRKAGAARWGRGRRPVINVSWHDAQAYVEWLSQQTGESYRLPSEAEWEYACRAGTTTSYTFGEEIGEKEANFAGNKTTEVGKYPPNPWGLYDMHGNVNEWVADVWHNSYEGAPADGSAWTDGEGWSVCRGGFWSYNSLGVKSTSRDETFPDNRHSTTGFRVARTLD